VASPQQGTIRNPSLNSGDAILPLADLATATRGPSNLEKTLVKAQSISVFLLDVAMAKHEAGPARPTLSGCVARHSRFIPDSRLLHEPLPVHTTNRMTINPEGRSGRFRLNAGHHLYPIRCAVEGSCCSGSPRFTTVL
jgi:hypothetical protein